MTGVMKKPLTGHRPVIEYRGSADRYFVVFPDLELELVMAFESKWTARELAANIYAGTPFYTAIPVVAFRSAYPRVGMIYPRLVLEDITLRII